MKALERRRIVEHSQDCGRFFNGLLDEVFAYGVRKGLAKPILRLYDECADLWDQLPEDWEGQARGMLAASTVLGRPDRAAAFARATSDRLAPKERRLARVWRETPWRFAVYTIAEDLGDDLLEGAELEIGPSGHADWSPETFLLYSPATARPAREGRRLFLALLWPNGECFQTYGPVIPFLGFEPEDFAFLARELAATPRTRGRAVQAVRVDASASDLSLARSMMNDPIPYLALMRFSETPPVVNRESPVVYCNGWAELPGGDPPTIAAALRTSGELVAGVARTDRVARILLGQGSPMHDPIVYYDGATARIHIAALTEAAYERARRALEPLVALPDRPQRRCTLPMRLACEKILQGESEVDRLAQVIEEFEEGLSERGGGESGTPTEQAAAGGPPGEPHLPEGPLPTLEQANAIIERLTDDHNEGREEDDETIAAALRVDPRTVAALRSEVTTMLGRMNAGSSADRFGLSPSAFESMTSGGLPNLPGVLRLRSLAEYRGSHGIAELAAGTRLVRCARWLLSAIESRQSVHATEAGNLPVKLMEEAHASGLFPVPEDAAGEIEAIRDLLHPRKEGDWAFLHELRLLLQTTKLLLLDRRSFRVAGGALELLQDPLRLHRMLLEALLTTAEWRMVDRFPTVARLQASAGFLLYAARRLSGPATSAQWVDAMRIGEVFARAYPTETNRGRPGELDVFFQFLPTMVRYRFVEFFATGLGLLEGRETTPPRRIGSWSHEVRTGKLFDALFES